MQIYVPSENAIKARPRLRKKYKNTGCRATNFNDFGTNTLRIWQWHVESINPKIVVSEKKSSLICSEFAHELAHTI